MNDDTRANIDYRRLLATASKIETIQSNLDTVIDYFLAPIVKLYNKLSNDCLKLLFEGKFKLDHFRKVEELIWRRIYHDIYKFQKSKRQHTKRQDECVMEAHFVSGIGFYSTLIIRLRSHFKINDVPGLVYPLGLSLGPIDNFALDEPLNSLDETNTTDKHSDSQIDREARDWACLAIYRSLVYMGDLARYLLDISQLDYREVAFQCYKSASRYQSEFGLPYNQLATLSGGLNYNLSAVCNYMRCCTKTRPFDGAEGNLKKIFELNRKLSEDIDETSRPIKVSEVISSRDPGQAAELMIKSIILSFIDLVSDLWLALSERTKLNNDRVSIETQIFFEGLSEAFELGPTSVFESACEDFAPLTGFSASIDKPRRVSSTIMYEFCSISIMLIAKCQKSLSSDSDIDKRLVAEVLGQAELLCLNLLHYATSRCHKMILSKLQDNRLRAKQKTDTENINLVPSDSSEFDRLSTNGCLKSYGQYGLASDINSKRALSRLRQKKAASNYSNDLSVKCKPHQSYHEDSDMSELEETALSTIDALDISSEMSEGDDNEVDDLINLDSSDGETPSPKTNSLSNFRIGRMSKPPLRITKSQTYEPQKRFDLRGTSSLQVHATSTRNKSNEKMDPKVSSHNQSPVEFADESSVQDKSSLCTDDEDDEDLEETSEFEVTFSYVYNQTYLPTIKIYFDWLLSNPAVINTNLASFRDYRKELDKLTGLLRDLIKMTELESNCLYRKPSQNDILCQDHYAYEHPFDGSHWKQKYPMSCDFPLINLSPLESVHKLSMDFQYTREINHSESGYLTVQCVFAFAHALSIFLKNKEDLD